MPKPIIVNDTLIDKPWNITLKRNPKLEYTKVRVNVKLRIVSKDAILTLLFSENCQEFSKFLNNETLLINVSTQNYQPVKFEIKDVRLKKIELKLTFINPLILSTK
jgi:hypothetical protein